MDLLSWTATRWTEADTVRIIGNSGFLALAVGTDSHHLPITTAYKLTAIIIAGGFMQDANNALKNGLHGCSLSYDCPT